MHLVKYRVHKFRSVKGTEWIDVDPKVTCFVGLNESGKTNLLLPLWELNPAGGLKEINFYENYPRNEFSKGGSKSEDERKNTPFIEAIFYINPVEHKRLHGELANHARSLKEIDKEDNRTMRRNIFRHKCILLQRDYNGKFYCYSVNKDGEIFSDNYVEKLDEISFQKIFQLPKFIYYPDYAKLNPNINLPEVRSNLDNMDSLPTEERIKTRALKNLFDYLNLDINEIIELGNNTENSDVEFRKKQERRATLDLAATQLSNEFNSWCSHSPHGPEGEYTIEFNVDGPYFQVLVKDSERPTLIGLEARSRGFQWFFSFFLFFLAESGNNHDNCVLLLDEPGLHLHPNAQSDLIKFLDKLSEKNQLMYTTHLPFLINDKNLKQVRVVSTKEGLTKVSNSVKKEPLTIQPLLAAMGIYSSQIYFIGYDIVIVEGVTDEQYLIKIYQYMVSKGKCQHNKWIRFVPSEGAKGASTLAEFMNANNNVRPALLLDSDQSGKGVQDSLKKKLYRGCKHKILDMNSFVDKKDPQIEDILPEEIVTNSFNELLHENRIVHGNKNFQPSNGGKKLSIMSQMKQFIKDNKIESELKAIKGWKFELSVKVLQKFDQHMEKLKKDRKKLQELEDRWQKLFEAIQEATRLE